MARRACPVVWVSGCAIEMLLRILTYLLPVWLIACQADRAAETALPDRPVRIVSLDYCADQYVLKLADREQILAVSPDAAKDFSYMRDAAMGLPTVRPVTEDVMILKPDLVVRSYGGGPNATAFFERAGIPVLQIGWISSLNKDEPGSIPSVIQHVAEGLGQSSRGEALVADFQDRLRRIEARADGQTALYMSQGGVTTGPGSLIHEMLQAAGLENFQRAPGWHSLPLERLAYEQPDLIAAAFFETLTNGSDAWTPANHPIAQEQLASGRVVPLEGAWTSCGGWYILDAVEALADGGHG